MVVHSRTHILIIKATWGIVRKTALFAQVRGEGGMERGRGGKREGVGVSERDELCSPL